MFINKWKYIVAKEFNGFRAHVDNGTVFLEKISAEYNGIAKLMDDISITRVSGKVVMPSTGICAPLAVFT